MRCAAQDAATGDDRRRAGHRLRRLAHRHAAVVSRCSRDLKVDNLRARTAGAADGPSVTADEQAGVPVYKVVGVVSRNGELMLPSGRYRDDRSRPAGRLAHADCADMVRPASRRRTWHFVWTHARSSWTHLRADLARPRHFLDQGHASQPTLSHQSPIWCAIPLSGGRRLGRAIRRRGTTDRR